MRASRHSPAFAGSQQRRDVETSLSMLRRKFRRKAKTRYMQWFRVASRRLAARCAESTTSRRRDARLVAAAPATSACIQRIKFRMTTNTIYAQQTTTWGDPASCGVSARRGSRQCTRGDDPTAVTRRGSRRGLHDFRVGAVNPTCSRLCVNASAYNTRQQRATGRSICTARGRLISKSVPILMV